MKVINPLVDLVANYAIGDVQGCYDSLMHLLDHIQFDAHTDRLWFVGDLVNRGPQSLAVLRFIQKLPVPPRIVLGNHDLHLLNCIFNEQNGTTKDTFQDILKAPDKEDLGLWLLKQPLVIYDEPLQIVMSHAGIYPLWSLEDALYHASFFAHHLQGPHFKAVLAHLYGNQPDRWANENLTLFEKLRFICNAFTRMRFCSAQGQLLLEYKGEVEKAPNNHFPWYAIPSRCMIKPAIVFGHWAALQGKCPLPNIYAIDKGCVWGGSLLALRLEDKLEFEWAANGS